jgi:hypothetical protein
LVWRSIQKIKIFIVAWVVSMCVLECIFISIYKEEYKKLNDIKKNIIPKLKKFYKELFVKSFT